MIRALAVKPSDEQLGQLVMLLWNAQRCDRSCQDDDCKSRICYRKVLKRQQLFIQHYIALAKSLKVGSPGHQIIKTHGDLLRVINILQASPQTTKRLVKAEIIHQFQTGREIATTEIDAAIDIALEAMLMIAMPKRTLSPRILEDGNGPQRWPEDVCLCDFLDSYVSTGEDLQMPSTTNDSFLDNLMARKIIKHCKVEFLPTNDIRDHLRFDPVSRSVHIFHNVSFIEESLRKTRDPNVTSLLPRDFLLEVLDSIQLVLFPLTDPRSNKLLKALIAERGFDARCTSWEMSSPEIRGEFEKDSQFTYLRNRLVSLYSELRDPTPKDNWEHWLERRSGRRYAMLATLIGVAVAVFLGIVGLVISALQAYFSYQAWKHPTAQT